MKNVQGGDKLKAWARQWGKGGIRGVKVGFFKTARYQGGVETRGSAKKGNLRSRKRKPHPVALVAAWNEFGTRSRRGKSITPERPFFRNAIKSERNRKGIVRVMKEGIDAKRGTLSVNGAARVGERMKGYIQTSIRDLREPPNSETTIAWKESTNPLIDTGLMRTSVSYIIISETTR